jgi:hypothetical protein
MKKNETKTTISEILNLRRYNPNYIPPQEKAILTINQKICGTAENYVVISGLPKSCKSTFLSAFTASALMLDDVWNIKISLTPGKEKIAYFDTESSAYDMYRQIQRIQKFTKRDYLPWEHFDVFNVREDEPQRIIEYINCYLENDFKILDKKYLIPFAALVCLTTYFYWYPKEIKSLENNVVDERYFYPTWRIEEAKLIADYYFWYINYEIFCHILDIDLSDLNAYYGKNP